MSDVNQKRGSSVRSVIPRPQRSIIQGAITYNSDGSAGQRGERFPEGASVICRRQHHHSSCRSDLKIPIIDCNEADFRSRLQR